MKSIFNRMIFFVSLLDYKFFTIVFFVLTIPVTWFFIDREVPEFYYCIYIWFCYFFVAYFLTIVATINMPKTVIKLLIVVPLSIYQLLNFLSVLTYSKPIDNTIIQIAANTNWNETREYCQAFILNYWILGCVSFIFLLIISSLLVVKWISKRSTKLLSQTLFIVFLISCIAVVKNPAVFVDCFDLSLVKYIFLERIDLREHYQHPEIVATKEAHPQYLVVIIGESYSKRYSSLYDYKVINCPNLQSLVEDSSLVLYTQVESPSVGTDGAFRYIINANRRPNADHYYEKATIAEIFRSVGYRTLWFSNQAEKGLFDSMSSGFAKVCDEQHFTGFPNQNKYDGKLIDMITQYQFKDDEKYLVFVHLMGQHEGFHERYPEEYSVYNAEEYREYPENQREIRARYDNATLYNDFVVSSIMNQFRNKEAIVYYFPDHGMDIFVGDPTYYGHAKETQKSQEEGFQIPFVVFTSEAYDKRFPREISIIKCCRERAFNTEDFTFMLMDIVGYKFKNNDDVASYSIYSK